MQITNSTRLRTDSAYTPSFKYAPLKSRFQLTNSDRVGIEWLLSAGLTAECPYPTLIEGFLRHKLRSSKSAPEPAPHDLVVPGRLVSYMTSGDKARRGKVTIIPNEDDGSIPVTSFLGATMLGMRKKQRMPLLREDSGIDILVVLDVLDA
ncbi:hypothetical protein [Celeribacter sp.]|uniref:hypothetical protein n=1 Tax=Celeribacter sp. TaxID=1890673 RepID=UPI003A95B533